MGSPNCPSLFVNHSIHATPLHVKSHFCNHFPLHVRILENESFNSMCLIFPHIYDSVFFYSVSSSISPFVTFFSFFKFINLFHGVIMFIS